MQMKPFTGAITAIVTPFKADYSIDLAKYAELIERQKSAGISGIVVSGTTGEAPTLTDAERIKLIATALEFQSNNFKIYVGTGTNSTDKTIEEIGYILNSFKNTNKKPDGIMVVLPYYNKPIQQGLFEHFVKICDSFKSESFCIYNVPSRTSSNITPTTFIKLCKACQNIVALKEASGDIRTLCDFKIFLDNAQVSSTVSLLSGDDCSFIPALLAGANGVISVSSNLLPQVFVQIFNAYQQADFNALKQLHLDLFTFHNSLFIAPNPMPLKWILNRMQLCSGVLRLPLTVISEAEALIIEENLKNLAKKSYLILPHTT